MSIIAIHTEEALQAMKLTVLRDHYNKLIADTDAKPIKGFKDKKTAITRCITAQGEYVERHPPKTDKVNKRKAARAETEEVRDVSKRKAQAEGKRGKQLVDTKLEVLALDDPKEGTTKAVMFAGIADGYDTKEKLIGYVLNHYQRPSLGDMDRRLALRRLNKAIAEGAIGIVE